MAMNNTEILTQQRKAIARKKQKGAGELKEIVFDDNARHEYLTGFHKRNIVKKEAKVAKAKERQRLERLDFRREKRRELAERAISNNDAVERAYRKDDSDEGFASEEDPSTTRAKEEELEFEDEEQLATVTVIQDFDVELFDGPVSGSSTNLGVGVSTRQERSASASIHGSSKPRTDSKTRKVSKKRPAYESKAERAASKSKMKAKRSERIEDGKSRQKLKGARQRSKTSKRPGRPR